MAEVTTRITEFFINSKTVQELETNVAAVLSSQSVPVASRNIQESNNIITMEEVSWHDEANDCWIIIFDKVYNITEFLDEVSDSFISIIFVGCQANQIGDKLKSRRFLDIVFLY